MTGSIRTAGILVWQQANRWLRPFGHELIRSAGSRPSSYRLQQIRLPARFAASRWHPDLGTFVVELDKTTSDCGFSFAPGGWHPFVATLGEYAEDPALDYRESTLYRLHQSFQPETVQELLLEDEPAPLSPLNEWPPIRRLFRRVWALTPWLARRELRAAQPPTQRQRAWLYFGPTPDAYVKKEFDRLVSVYRSIRQIGYQPAVARESQVNGYFLCQGDDYRFVILNGNHRAAALRLLGVSEIPVVIRTGHPTVVHGDHLDQWTIERGGLYPAVVANRLFAKMFSEDGARKAAAIGLLDRTGSRGSAVEEGV